MTRTTYLVTVSGPDRVGVGAELFAALAALTLQDGHITDVAQITIKGALVLCAEVTAAVAIVYLGVYTPLKRYTWMCNIVGAIPGALPPVAGWAAARGGLTWEPPILFAIMFLWQLPHTLAVARLYRTDYARAGIHLLPQDNTRGGNASNPIVIAGSLGLIALGIIPTMLGYAGLPYMVIASAMGVWMLAFGVTMVRSPGNSKAARRLLLASLLYLPIVLLVLVLDRV